MKTPSPSWLVLNQSQSPAFQRLLARLGERYGACRTYTGMPHYPAEEGLTLAVGPAYDKRSALHRALSWARFMAGAVWVGLRSPRGTFIFAVTNPPFLLHVAYLLRLLRGTPYALLVWDLYPDHVVKLGWASDRNLLVRAWRALNRRAFLGATAVITLGKGMADAIRAQLLPGEACRVEVIPNWADVEAIRPLPKAENPFAQRHGQVGKVTVMYSGNLGATHGTRVIAAIAEACRSEPDLAFLVVGDGLGRAELEEEVRRRGLANVAFVDYQPWEMLPLSLSTAEIALVMQVPGTEHLSVPSKTYSHLAAGSAVVALTSNESDLARLVRDHGVGAVRPFAAPDAAAQAIREFAADRGALAEARRRARTAAEAHFSAEAVFERFAAVLGPALTAASGEGLPA